MARFIFTLSDDLLKKTDEYCKKYGFSQAEFIRSLIRNEFYAQAPVNHLVSRPPLPPHCSLCKLKKENMIKVEAQDVCLDCFDTLPDDLKMSYHPLEP